MKRLFDIPVHQLEKYPNEKMFSFKKNNVWESISTKSFMKQVNELSTGLISIGVKADDKIGIISLNRYEWNITDVASLQIGAIVVPLYPTISTNDYKYIFNDAKIKICFVGDLSLYNKIISIKSEIPSLEKIYCFDEHEGVLYWRELAIPELNVSEIKERSNKIVNTDLATIIYTSGTTGNPKGVMLSHLNIVSNLNACIDRMPCNELSRVLTFLPLCHVYERMLHYLYMYTGCAIYFAESMETIGDNIREVKPHMFTAVPRLIEKVYDKIIQKGEELTGIKRTLFFWAVSVGSEYDVMGKSFFYKIKLFIARKLIFKKWQLALGGETIAIASGSAALQPKLARMFLAAGINVLEGYGLTETSPVVAVNCLKNGIRIGTVGTLIDGVSVKLAEDGEILVKGPNVMIGYYNQPEITAETIDKDGWFHTGDIGLFIEKKFLKITDRKKEIFKTSGGKYIVPQMMENKFKESRFIEQIMIIGEGEKFPAALIVPNFTYIREWHKQQNHGKTTDSNESIAIDTIVIDKIEKEIEIQNATLGNWEQVKKFRLLSAEFSIDGGELTPTLKLKRKVILEKYKQIIESIYTQ